jgi:hypothetical protein
MVLGLNFLFSALSMTLLILSIYVLLSDWGKLAEGFFIGWCVSIILFSIIIKLIACTGSLGVTHQNNEFGCCSGGRILFLYFISLTGTIIVVFYVYYELNKLIGEYQNIYDDIDLTDQDVSYSDPEMRLSDTFNDLFFTASSTCSGMLC